MGSVKLTPEKRRLLVQAIEAGGSDHRAARAAGIDPRTFRLYRQIAEGRHPTRRPWPSLVELFVEIEEASARATLRQEIEVANRDPKHWLRYRAPSKPGLDGWTAPVPEEPEEKDLEYQPSPEELEQTVLALAEALGLIEDPAGDRKDNASE